MKNTNWTKKLLLILIVTFMVGSLAACGSKTKQPDVEDNGTSGEIGGETDGETSPTGEKTQITFWSPFSGGDGDHMKAMVKGFNEQSDTTEVEFLIYDSTEYYTKLLAAISSDTSPTVAISHMTRIKEYAEDDLILPLDDLAAQGGVEWSEFTEKLQTAINVNGSYYAVPLDTHLLLMHFNKEILEEIGMLDADGYPAFGQGEDEFFRFFEEVKSKLGNGQMPISGTSAGGLPMYLWYSFLTQNGGDILAEDGTTVTLNTPENKKALNTIMRMVDEELWPKNQKNGAEIFTAGKAAAMINGVWAIPTLESIDGLDFLPLPFPQLTDTKSVYADSHTIILPKNKNRTDAEDIAAMEFMKWISDNTATWANAGHIPSKPAVLETEEFLNLPYRSEYASSAEYAHFFPQTKGIAGFTELVQRELGAMISGEQDVDTTASNLQTEFEAIID